MVDAVFDPNAFRVTYPQFASVGSFPDALLQAYFETSAVYLGKRLNCNYFMNNPRLILALNLMTAHFASISAMIASGNTPGIMTGATIDKISITMEPPPVESQFAWWLNQTPYGAQLYALLSIVSVGGAYFGGRPEIPGFRRGGGF